MPLFDLEFSMKSSTKSPAMPSGCCALNSGVIVFSPFCASWIFVQCLTSKGLLSKAPCIEVLFRYQRNIPLIGQFGKKAVTQIAVLYLFFFVKSRLQVFFILLTLDCVVSKYQESFVEVQMNNV